MSDKVNWKSIKILPDSYYTILDSGILEHKLGSTFKLLKMRNPFEQTEYKGEGSESDVLFWDQINETEEKSRLLKQSTNSVNGIFYMLFQDYIKYFS